MPIAAIEWGKLAELLWAAPLAGLAVAVTYSLTILGSARAGEARRAGENAAFVAYGILAVAGGAGFLATVVFALSVITSK
jgi:hypothetical protein